MTKDEQIDAVRAAMTQVVPYVDRECPIVYPTMEMLEDFTEEQWDEFLAES